MLTRVVRFVAIFVVTFVVLVLPWPTGGYLGFFRVMATKVFSREDGRREVRFLDATEPALRATRTRVEIANRDLLKPDGSGSIRFFDLDGFRFGWLPTAFLIALVLASPRPMSRRLVALAWGVPFLQLVILGLLEFIIWTESAHVGLVTTGPFFRDLTTHLRLQLAMQISLGAPVLIWMVLTFRREDFARLRISSVRRETR